MQVKYTQSDGSKILKFKYEFNIYKILNLFNFLIPKKFVLSILERNFTDFGLELTNACNANCSFCAYRFMQRGVKITSFEDFKKIVNNYNIIGGGDLNFTPVVGDPLVDKNIIDSGF